MLINKGILPVGIEIAGVTYRDFEYRSQLVRDAIEIMESPDAARAAQSDAFYGVCAMAKRLTVVGVPREAMTAELIMDMEQLDFNHLAEIDKQQAAQRDAFRGAAKAAPDAAARAPEVGI